MVGEWDGLLILRVSGPGSWELFRRESGGHRWQRKPPNERRDRTHSSTITVAVLPEVAHASLVIRESDCVIVKCRGSGPGGQNRNKTDSAVQVKHRATGTIVRCETERSQQQNLATAMALLSARLNSAAAERAANAERESRRSQIGSGERSDKIRTVQFQNGQVVNHLTGKRLGIEKYLKGDIAAIQ